MRVSPGKPRPVVIVQDERFDALEPVTICGLTSDTSDAPLFRVVIEPGPGNGLKSVSRAMADKITAVPKNETGRTDRQTRLGGHDPRESRDSDLPGSAPNLRVI